MPLPDTKPGRILPFRERKINPISFRTTPLAVGLRITNHNTRHIRDLKRQPPVLFSHREALKLGIALGSLTAVEVRPLKEI